MITKKPRNNEGYYDLKVTDRNGNAFIMTVGGNLDLYWVPENYRENTIFYIEKGDEITYSVFEQLFRAVEKNDDKYRPVINGNTLTFVSEEWREEESNHLKITKEEDSFVVEFVKNENEEEWSVPRRGCAICFCNSGSRVPRVESLFMRLFNHLAYNSDLLQCEEDEGQM